MTEKLTDDEIEDLIFAMWSLTVDERGQPFQAYTRNGQFALDMLGKIVVAMAPLKLKEGQVIQMPDRRKVSPPDEPEPSS